MMTSLDPITATTSAISPPLAIVSSAWQAISDGDRIFTRHGPVAAVRHDVAPVLAARPFDRHVGLAGRHRESLREDQEVLDERLHLGVDLVLRRRHHARIVGPVGAASGEIRSSACRQMRMLWRISSTRTM